MTSGVPTQAVKDHWKKQSDGTYRSTHPKYDGMWIENVKFNQWLLHCPHQGDPVKRNSLQECKHYAYMEANWVAPSCREYV